jgi:uncharacterized protein YbjT (DUF2867 family)
MNAFVLGATGLVGRNIVQELDRSSDYKHIVAPVRRPTGIASDKLIEVPFDAEQASEWDTPVTLDHAFIAFGTTVKKAGGHNAQWEVDVRYPRLYAQRLKDLGVRHISVCSSIGADFESSNAYSRMKGQLEEDIRLMRFPSFATLRPSVLGGERENDERPAEAWAQRIMSRLPKRWRTVPARRVAQSMVATAREEPMGMTIISSKKIWALSDVAEMNR